MKLNINWGEKTKEKALPCSAQTIRPPSLWQKENLNNFSLLLTPLENVIQSLICPRSATQNKLVFKS